MSPEEAYTRIKSDAARVIPTVSMIESFAGTVAP